MFLSGSTFLATHVLWLLPHVCVALISIGLRIVLLRLRLHMASYLDFYDTVKSEMSPLNETCQGYLPHYCLFQGSRIVFLSVTTAATFSFYTLRCHYRYARARDYVKVNFVLYMCTNYWIWYSDMVFRSIFSFRVIVMLPDERIVNWIIANLECWSRCLVHPTSAGSGIYAWR